MSCLPEADLLFLLPASASGSGLAAAAVPGCRWSPLSPLPSERQASFLLECLPYLQRRSLAPHPHLPQALTRFPLARQSAFRLLCTKLTTEDDGDGQAPEAQARLQVRQHSERAMDRAVAVRCDR